MPELSLRQSVQSALDVHECWEAAVRQMLEHGQAHGPISNLSSKDHARIAQWLNPAPGHEYDSHHLRVVTRHRAFRDCVARITDCVVQGDISQAEQLLRADFTHHSRAVKSALRQWDRDLSERGAACAGRPDGFRHKRTAESYAPTSDTRNMVAPQ